MPEPGGRLRELFDRALALPAEARAAFVERECDGDAALAGALRDLLTHAETDGDRFLEGEPGRATPQMEVHPPERIGQHRIIREIGRGGMGVVYEAEQASPRRRVALKVVRAGLGSDVLVSRFRREAQVLAQLQHHGIAQIYESGSATLGGSDVPYFAMELVDGCPLDEHARLNALTPRQRLELIARVCDAVQHAHQKGVIHRDLKPSNVLVVEESSGVPGEQSTVVDAIGQPKILDFGIARFTDADVQATVHTSTGQIVGTLAYMSPEQVDGRPEDLDTRCDVYALGVLLYHVMAGRSAHELGGLPIAEAARVIREVEPEPLGSIDAALRGDVSTIAAKAMEKDRDRRYASAGLLAEDIRRHLRDEPIAARPASAFYQLTKFTRRHRALVGGVAATLIALTAGLAVALVLLASTIRERDAKQAALDEANDVTEFFSAMLLEASPEIGDKDMTVREMLDRSADTIEARFRDRPLLEARIRATMGKTYASLGEFDTAAEQFAGAIRLRERAPHASPIDLLNARIDLGETHRLRAEYGAALEVLDGALGAAPPTPDATIPLARGRAQRASVLVRTGRLDEASEELESVLETLAATPAAPEEHRLHVRAELAHIASLRGDERAESLYLELIEASSEALGGDHPATLTHMSNLGALYRNRGQSDRAIPVLRRVLEAQSDTLGPAHRQTLISANVLAQALSFAGRPEEARPVLQDAIDVARRERGEDSASSLFLTFTLGGVLRQEGDLDGAERVMTQSAEAHRRIQGPDAEGTYFAESTLRNLLIARGKLPEAIRLGESIVARAANAFPEDHPRVYQSRYDLARAYAVAERFEDAEAMFLAAHGHADAQWGGAIRRGLVRLYERWGRPGLAAEWRNASSP